MDTRYKELKLNIKPFPHHRVSCSPQNRIWGNRGVFFVVRRGHDMAQYSFEVIRDKINELTQAGWEKNYGVTQ